MSIHRMREGDTIIPASGLVGYEVEDVDRFAGTVRARQIEGRRTKTFQADRLEEVDEGLWQEMEVRRGW